MSDTDSEVVAWFKSIYENSNVVSIITQYIYSVNQAIEYSIIIQSLHHWLEGSALRRWFRPERDTASIVIDADRSIVVSSILVVLTRFSQRVRKLWSIGGISTHRLVSSNYIRALNWLLIGLLLIDYAIVVILSVATPMGVVARAMLLLFLILCTRIPVKSLHNATLPRIMGLIVDPIRIGPRDQQNDQYPDEQK